MRSKKNLLEKSRLYIILDKKTAGNKPLRDAVIELKKTKADIIQLRDKESCSFEVLKEAFSLKKALNNTGKLFIVNDSVEIAKIVDSDGVHLGQKDTSINIARQILGKDKIIGISCSNLKQAIAAEKSGADYIGIGPIFATITKPEGIPIGLSLLSYIIKRVGIPVFAIGNINSNNINSIISSGCKRIAVCRAVLKNKKILNKANLYSSYLN